MGMKNKIQNMPKNVKIAIGAVILVVAIALVVKGGMGKKEAPAVLPVPEETQEQVVAPKPTKPSSSKPSTTTYTDNRSYTELIGAYKNTLVQFGTSCQVLKSNQVFKVGTEVLLDNRNSVPVTLKIGSSVHNLGAYGYKVISLASEGTFMVDCNDHQNVATITVQK